MRGFKGTDWTIHGNGLAHFQSTQNCTIPSSSVLPSFTLRTFGRMQFSAAQCANQRSSHWVRPFFGQSSPIRPLAAGIQLRHGAGVPPEDIVLTLQFCGHSFSTHSVECNFQSHNVPNQCSSHWQPAGVQLRLGIGMPGKATLIRVGERSTLSSLKTVY